MPIPNPRSGETEQEFIPRCVRSIIDEYDRDQALGICYSQLRQKMSKMKDNEATEVFIIKPRKSENRGMYLKRCASNKKMREQYPNMKERSIFCLTSFNSYYKYWNRLEGFGEIPKDSALGSCIAKEKARGKDYKKAYAACSTKVVAPNTTIVLAEDLNIFGYRPDNFDMCPGAVETFKHLISMEVNDDTVGMIRSAAIVADKIFEIEKEVLDNEYTSPEDMEQVVKLVQDFKDIIHEVDEEVGMVHDVSYMDGHIEKVKEYFEDDENLLVEPVNY